MTTIFLVRHGEYENSKSIAPFRLPGFPLSAAGKRQAAKLGTFFKDKSISALFTSPITRCHQTAEIIGDLLSLRLQIDPHLIEVDSPLSGTPLDKLHALMVKNSLYAVPAQIAKGETPEEICDRMEKTLDRILTQFANRKVILVSHGDPIMILVWKLTGKSISLFKVSKEVYIPKGGFFQLEFSGKKLLRANLVKSC